MKINQLFLAVSVSLAAIPISQAATYRVVELPLQTLAKHSFGAAINESGEQVANVTFPFNPYIDVSLLDFENGSFVSALTDVEAAKAGNFNADDLATIYNYIRTENESVVFQQIGIKRSYYIEDSAHELVGYDIVDPATGSLTESNDVISYAINNAGYVVGQSEAPFRTQPYTNESGQQTNFVINDFSKRGFVEINNQLIELLPPDLQNGGISSAFGINNNNTVVGFGSIGVSDIMSSGLENCANEEERGGLSQEACNVAMREEAEESRFERRAMVWQLGDDGSIVDTKTLGMIISPEDDNEKVYFSRANAVNNHGLIVGVSSDYYRGNESQLTEIAAVFDGDTVEGFVDHEEYFGGSATAVNDNNIVVGYGLKQFNRITRNRMVVYDYNTKDVTYPLGFFNSSSTTPRSINNLGLVVGDAEIETGITSNRRRVGFLYNVDDGTFTDINTLLTCDSPYTIVQANDINERNEIIGTAEIYVQARDINGDLMTNSNDEPIMESKVVAVKLEPTSGEVESCELPSEETERKGGSLYWLLPVLAVLGFRRKK
ncbi:DUF3466 family protein [Aestuariibacter sp. AA17]|uniref:DUF3466 family protein n=1 Tax=Fluctibacter corallii TaxID=2984329 RepID=A0ABT3A666_9ALTE|nr:DUF3466 family protein [Aestuariibacter sp. AA17]MCV2884155.1 DUF3466 family protein [Aestuariibacter sp. AA17]